jgi:spermidine synthase
VPLPLLLATLAGVVSLVVEVVWMRLLSLSMGSASFAAGAVVACIMLGMALGSAAADRVTSRRARWLAAGLGALAAGAAAGAPLLRALEGPAGIAAAALFMTAFSMPMGAVVPLLAAGDAGRLYAGNTIGAAAGAALAGFFLLPALGNSSTLFVAAAAAAALAVLASKTGRMAPPPSASEPLDRRDRWILAAYGASALAAMVSEIGWIRGLALTVGSSTYAFSIVIGIYIAGLGLGAALSTRFLTGAALPAFGVVQLLAAAACLGTLQFLGVLPGIFGRLFFGQVHSIESFAGAAILVSAAAMLPPTILIGACFPIVLRALGGRAPGLTLGVATGGSMLGSLAGAFAAIPALGIERTLQAALVVHAAVGVAALGKKRLMAAGGAAAVAASAFALPAWRPEVVFSGPYIYGSRMLQPGMSGEKLFAEDDHVASVAVFRYPDGALKMLIDGKTDASTLAEDVATQLLLAHVPLSLHARPERVAVVGLGSGMTLAAALKHGPARVDCMEISPAVARAARLFGAPLSDPRVTLHIEDARRTLRRETGRFDAIISEPSNLWIAGMSALFTEEFYRLCESRLAEGGVMCQWLHAYALSVEPFRDALATFRRVFPRVRVWEVWAGGDYLLIGSREPVDRVFERPEPREDLKRIGIDGPEALRADLVATEAELDPVLKGARIQTDDGLHLEFSAPLGFYRREQAAALRLLPPASRTRELVRKGVLRRSETGERAGPMALFREALEDRQARFFMEERVIACLQSAAHLAASGEPRKAMAELDLVPRESSRFVEARLMVVELLGLGGAPGRMMAEEYARVLEAAPGHERASAGLAEIRLKEGSFEEARAAARRGVEKNPRSAMLRLIHGKILKEMNRRDEARSEWEEAANLDPAGPWGAEARRLLQN